MTRSSHLSIKHLTPAGRRRVLAEAGAFDGSRFDALLQASLEDWTDDVGGFTENAVGVFPMALSVATGFVVNKVERFVPMVTEERSVVAAACKAAALCRPHGFHVKAKPPLARAQILLVPDRPGAVSCAPLVNREAERFVAIVRGEGDPLVKYGGGLLAIEARKTPLPGEPEATLVNLTIDVGEIMGANKATRIAEALGSLIEKHSSSRVAFKICGNDTPERRVRAVAVWRKEALGEDVWKRKNRDVGNADPPAEETRRLGDDAIGRFLLAQECAEIDPERAATHDKGIMNGVDAVCLATGQDTRAVNAGFWVEACRGGTCRPLSRFRRTTEGHLRGELEMPLAVGVKGGATAHPMVVHNLRTMRCQTAAELMQVIGAVGLAQNFAALFSLTNEGIIASHERLKKGS